MLFKLKEMRRKRDCATYTRVISGRLIHRLREQIHAPGEQPFKHRWNKNSQPDSESIFSPLCLVPEVPWGEWDESESVVSNSSTTNVKLHRSKSLGVEGKQTDFSPVCLVPELSWGNWDDSETVACSCFSYSSNRVGTFLKAIIYSPKT